MIFHFQPLVNVCFLSHNSSWKVKGFVVGEAYWEGRQEEEGGVQVSSSFPYNMRFQIFLDSFHLAPLPHNQV